MSSFKYMLASVLCCALVSIAVSLPNQKPNDEPEPLSPDFFSDNGPFFGTGRDCPQGEVARPGMLPSCEPTCENPRPICVKLYSLDYPPCFCQAPKVRDTITKQCVEISQCPTQVGRQRRERSM